MSKDKNTTWKFIFFFYCLQFFFSFILQTKLLLIFTVFSLPLGKELKNFLKYYFKKFVDY